jgi:CDP-diacylglycerol--serine O-phosphatidyltransferase
MKLVKQIPNLLTLGNLFCGTVATIFAVQGNFICTAFFVVLGIVFDFFDGFAARLLNVTGDLGKQLDSLADMVTSGVVPSIVMYQLLKNDSASFELQTYFPFLGLLLALGACYRLAKFNIDTRQSDSFIGLPTPAMSLFVVTLPLIQYNSEVVFVQMLLDNNYFLLIITVLLTYLMNAELPLFSLKFKNYSFTNNKVKYFFLVLMLIVLEFLAIPTIIILYVLLSVFQNYKAKIV